MYLTTHYLQWGFPSKSFHLTEEVWTEFSPIVTQFIARIEAAALKSQQNNASDIDIVDSDEVNEDVEEQQLDLTNTRINPYTLWKLLERLGYTKHDFKSNGWEFDFWITFKKPGCKSLLVWGTGITFNLWLTEAQNC